MFMCEHTKFVYFHVYNMWTLKGALASISISIISKKIPYILHRLYRSYSRKVS